MNPTLKPRSSSESRSSSERGVALIHAVLFVSLATAAVTAATGVQLARHQAHQRRAHRLQALYAAESGAAEAIARLRGFELSLPPVAWERSVGAARCRITVKEAGENGFTIVSDGVCNDQRERVVIHAGKQRRNPEGDARASGSFPRTVPSAGVDRRQGFPPEEAAPLRPQATHPEQGAQASGAGGTKGAERCRLPARS